MPQMEEGSILYMPTTLPGVPIKEAGWVLQQMDKKLAAFPEVASVFGKLGRADTATDAAPVSMIESTILLKDREGMAAGMTKDQLVAEMDEAMQIVGYANSWVQPINARTVMQDTGIQTPAGIKVKGFDVATIESIARAGRASAARLPRHAVRDRGAHLVGLFHRRRVRPAAPRGGRHHRRGSDARRALRASAATTSSRSRTTTARRSR